MLEKTYRIEPNAPLAMSLDDYARKCKNEYGEMLSGNPLDESSYQSFLERNPCMIPGVMEGNPSHAPLFHAVITQPEIGDEIQRRPDFMWITLTSLELIPVLIEIERPDKKEFRASDNVQNAKFTQAVEQIKEWKVLLKSQDGFHGFCERYSIPERYRELGKFKPRYKLVYGRREEFESNSWLAGKRRESQYSDLEIMSFDRLSPCRDAMNYGCVRISKGRAPRAVAIPPTFRMGPVNARAIAKWDDFDKAVRASTLMSSERISFLRERRPYWKSWAEADASSQIRSLMDTEDWE